MGTASAGMPMILPMPPEHLQRRRAEHLVAVVPQPVRIFVVRLDADVRLRYEERLGADARPHIEDRIRRLDKPRGILEELRIFAERRPQLI